MEPTTTRDKALRVNLDPSKYGTFAEIGAGQEVARWFFNVGGASGTIAKTISAYDMVVSDSIYGPAGRYVSQHRLDTMLDHEYQLLTSRLAAQRGASTRFFVFANTVATTGFAGRDDAHGWLGIRFQVEPGAAPSAIILHVRLLDRDRAREQEALGVLGVNLIHAAMYLHQEPDQMLRALIDEVGDQRVEVDMIRVAGPAFARVDNRLLALRLVQFGLTNGAMFMASGEVVPPAEALRKQNLLVLRGSFRPVTNTTLDMLRAARAMFVQEPAVDGHAPAILMEMTLKNLMTDQGIDHADYLARVAMLQALGHDVLISNYLEYHRLAAYLFRYSKQMIGLVMGVPTLREVFDERYYAELEGGILESLGRLFKNQLKLYVYPLLDADSGALITAGNLRVAPHLRHLYAYLVENRFIDGIRDVDSSCLPIFSRDVLRRIRTGDAAWEGMVPGEVATLIKSHELLGYRPGPTA